MLFQRKAIIPVWLVVFGLLALFGSMTVATGAIVLVLGTGALSMMLALSKTPSPTIAEVLRDAETSRRAR